MTEVKVDGINSNPISTNQDPASPTELVDIAKLRQSLQQSLSQSHISKYESLTDDNFLLRFLRGYNNSVSDAQTAFESMSQFRLENNVAELTDQLLKVEQETGTLPYVGEAG